MDSFENPPPMGYGGPEFAKNKAKLSKECKMQRDVPIPPVDQGGFNDEGDCVLEGNVLQQIKVSEFPTIHISFVTLHIILSCLKVLPVLLISSYFPFFVLDIFKELQLIKRAISKVGF